MTYKKSGIVSFVALETPEGLYEAFLSLPKSKEPESVMTSLKEKVHNWHARLGHAIASKIKKIISHIAGIKKEEIEPISGVCDQCRVEKSSRKSRRSEKSITSKSPLERFYTDVVGPMRYEFWEERNIS